MLDNFGYLCYNGGNPENMEFACWVLHEVWGDARLGDIMEYFRKCAVPGRDIFGTVSSIKR